VSTEYFVHGAEEFLLKRSRSQRIRGGRGTFSENVLARDFRGCWGRRIRDRGGSGWPTSVPTTKKTIRERCGEAKKPTRRIAFIRSVLDAGTLQRAAGDGSVELYVGFIGLDQRPSLCPYPHIKRWHRTEDRQCPLCSPGLQLAPKLSKTIAVLTRYSAIAPSAPWQAAFTISSVFQFGAPLAEKPEHANNRCNLPESRDGRLTEPSFRFLSDSAPKLPMRSR